MYTFSCAAGMPGAPPRMDLHEISRLRAAAEHARRALPGALGELAARELTAYADLGYLGAPDALVPQLADQVLALPASSPPSPSDRKVTRCPTPPAAPPCAGSSVPRTSRRCWSPTWSTSAT